MAYVVPRPRGTWELRISTMSPDGPRSRTLVSFRELSTDVVKRAIDRSGGKLSHGQVREAAIRAGAPVAPEPIRRAAVGLINELARGATLPPTWKPVLVDLIERPDEERADAEAIGEWADAGLRRRGEALRDLLLLADAIPGSGRETPLTFPGLSTGCA